MGMRCCMACVCLSVCFAAACAADQTWRTRNAKRLVVDPVGTAYLTDSHGAMGVVMALLETRETFPQYEPYLRGTLQWLYSVRVEQQDGSFLWPLSTSAPDNHPSRRQFSPKMPFGVAKALIQLDPELKDPLYKKLYEGCMQSLENEARRMERKLQRMGDQKFPIGLGAVHGPGGAVGALARISQATLDARFQKWAHLWVEIVKHDAKVWRDKNTTYASWHLKDHERTYWRKTDWRTGWCYGASGNVSGLMEFFRVFPDYRFEDGTSVLDLAGAGLNWIYEQKYIMGDGWNFMNIRTDGPTENPGMGSGVAGIGAVFLEGYELYKSTDPERAARYFLAAEKCAHYITYLLQDPDDDPEHRQWNLFRWDYEGRPQRIQFGGFQDMNLGYCGGIGNTGAFLIPMAEALRPRDPDLAAKCLKAVKVIAQWFQARSIPCGRGIAWTAMRELGGPDTIDIAADYGLSGMVRSLHTMATGLHDPQLMETTRLALEGMVSLAVKEGDGYKWPFLTEIKHLRDGS